MGLLEFKGEGQRPFGGSGTESLFQGARSAQKNAAAKIITTAFKKIMIL